MELTHTLGIRYEVCKHFIAHTTGSINGFLSGFIIQPDTLTQFDQGFLKYFRISI